jgi:hypothetical protein
MNMKIIKAGSETGANEREIEELERRVRSRLPADYRQFMIEFNGGEPQPRAFEGPDGEGSAVRFFFTLDPRSSHYWIHQKLDVYQDRIPPGLLPIASDSFGNLVLLDLGAKDYGVVYFWDHENESDDEPWWDNISPIAQSFSRFVDELR